MFKVRWGMHDNTTLQIGSLSLSILMVFMHIDIDMCALIVLNLVWFFFLFCSLFIPYQPKSWDSWRYPWSRLAQIQILEVRIWLWAICYVYVLMVLFWLTVGGVMAFLTLHEMLPLAFEYAGQKQSVKVVFCGMAFMSARYF